MAEQFAINEQKLGIDAVLVDFADAAQFEAVADADIHVNHTHIPDVMRKKVTKPFKTVWIGHGAVEHAFQTSVEQGLIKGYGAADGWMLSQYWLQHADAIVTFWPRQQAIWQSMCDKGRTVHCVPMGVDLDFWKPVPSNGRFLGNPSLFTAENAHYCKWPLDLFICWPWVYPEIENSYLHAIYMPNDQHRWFFPLINRNGAHYRMIPSPLTFGPEELRNAFCSTDYYIGMVRYGDFNRICLEANASGAKTISYRGNEYSDYWITEGDQRVMAQELTAILKGEILPRDKLPVPNALDTSREMLKIYEGIL